MNEPQMKRKVFIDSVSDSFRRITFYAPEEIKNALARFGTINEAPEKEKYDLYVDGRYDYHEVIDYIKSLEQPTTE